MQDAKSSKVSYKPLPSERNSSVAPGGTGHNQFNLIEIHEDKLDGAMATNNIEEVQSSVSHGGTGGQQRVHREENSAVEM